MATALRRPSLSGGAAAPRHLAPAFANGQRRPRPAAAVASAQQQQQQQKQQQRQQPSAAPANPAAPPAATWLATVIAPPPPPLPLVVPPPPAAAAAPSPNPPTAPVRRAGSLGFSRDFDAAYALGELIGEGASGRVHGATERATGRRVAVKVLPKRVKSPGGGSSSSNSGSDYDRASSPPNSPPTSTSSRAAAIQREVGATALAGAGSPFAARLEGVFECEDQAYLVLERCEGGDLRDLLAARGGEPLPEPAAAAALKGLLHALAACHARGMVFGDVKPSNVCLLRRRSSVELEAAAQAGRPSAAAGADDGGSSVSNHAARAAADAAAADAETAFFGGVRLVDYGAASPSPLPARSLVGSPLYWSPEQAAGYGGLMMTSTGGGSGSSGEEDGALAGGSGFGAEVDVWSAGVIAFQMMSGRLPYERRSHKQPAGAGAASSTKAATALRPWELLAAIRTAPIGAWPGASAEARDLVARMLDRDPKRRITAAQALEHPFFAKNTTSAS